MQLKCKFTITKLADEFIAVPLGDYISDFNGVLKLNETAAFIIEQLNDEISEEVLAKKIVEKFGCDLDYSYQNIHSIIDGLKEYNLVTE